MDILSPVNMIPYIGVTITNTASIQNGIATYTHGQVTWFSILMVKNINWSMRMENSKNICNLSKNPTLSKSIVMPVTIKPKHNIMSGTVIPAT